MNESPTTHPESIIVYDAEASWVDPDLAFDYIAFTGRHAAEAIVSGMVTEIAYGPGDGTHYGLVITPLDNTVLMPGRVWDDVPVGSPCPFRGGIDRAQHCLVSWINHKAYPISLRGRGDHKALAGSYIAEHFDTSIVSAVSITILLRSIAYWIDQETEKW